MRASHQTLNDQHVLASLGDDDDEKAHALLQEGDEHDRVAKETKQTPLTGEHHFPSEHELPTGGAIDESRRDVRKLTSELHRRHAYR